MDPKIVIGTDSIPPPLAETSPKPIENTNNLPKPEAPSAQAKEIRFRASQDSNMIDTIKSKVLDLVNRVFGEKPLPQKIAHEEVSSVILSQKNVAKRLGKVFGFFIKDPSQKEKILKELIEKYDSLDANGKKNIKHFLNGLILNEKPEHLELLRPQIKELNDRLKKDILPHFTSAELNPQKTSLQPGPHNLEQELNHLKNPDYDLHALAQAVAHDLKQESIALLKNIRSYELQNTTMTAKNRDLSPTVIAANLRGERLKSGIMEHILTAENKDKKRLIEFYLSLADELFKAGDFEALMAVTGALQSTPVIRLIGAGKITLDNEHQEIHEKMLALLNPQNGNEALRQAIAKTKGAVIQPTILLVKSATYASELLGNTKTQVEGSKLLALSDRFETVTDYQSLPEPQEISFNLAPLYHSRITNEGILFNLSQQAVGGKSKMLLDLSDVVEVLKDFKTLKLRITEEGLVAVDKSMFTVTSRVGQSDEAKESVEYVLDRVINSMDTEEPNQEHIIQAHTILTQLKKNTWVKAVLEKHPELDLKFDKAQKAFESANAKFNAKNTYGLSEIIERMRNDPLTSERIGLAFEFLYPRLEDQKMLIREMANQPNSDIFFQAIARNASRQLIEEGILPVSVTVSIPQELTVDGVIPETRNEKIAVLAHDLKLYANYLVNRLRGADIMNNNKSAIKPLADFDQNVQSWAKNTILSAKTPEELSDQYEFHIDLALKLLESHDYITAYSLISSLSNLERLFGEGKYRLSPDAKVKLQSLKEAIKDTSINQAYELAPDEANPLPPLLIMLRNLTGVAENKSSKGSINENNLSVAAKFAAMIDRIPKLPENIISYNLEGLFNQLPGEKELDHLEEKWLPRGLNFNLSGLVHLIRNASLGNKLTVEVINVNGSSKEVVRVASRGSLPGGIRIGKSETAKRALEQLLHHALQFMKLPQKNLSSSIQELSDYLDNDPWAQAVLENHPELQEKVAQVRSYASDHANEVLTTFESRKLEHASQGLQLLKAIIPKLGSNQKPSVRRLPSGEYDFTLLNRSDSIFDFSAITKRFVASSPEAQETLTHLVDLISVFGKNRSHPEREEAYRVLVDLLETPWIKDVQARFPDHPLFCLKAALFESQ